MPTVQNHNGPLPGSDDEVLGWGEQPPEHQTFDLSALRPAPHTHNYVAQGGYLHCDNGSHGIAYDHSKQIFVGVDAGGQPIFKPITFADERTKQYAARAEKTSRSRT